MGRFRYVEDDDASGDDIDGRHWEFVADPGTEGAIVSRGGTTPESQQENTATDPCTADHLAANQRAESFLSEAQSDWLGDYYYAHESNRKGRWWFWILVGAVLIQIAILFAPPAPPADKHEHENWRAFLLLHIQQLQESVTALMYHTPTHIGRWWVLGLVADAQQWYHDWKRAPPCRLPVPAENVKFVLDEFFFGQADAVQVVTDAVQAWEPDSSPLLLYLAGMRGVGKTTLAEAVARQLFPKDCPQVSLDASILTIDAGDFAVTDDSNRHMDEASVRMQLAQRILRHVQRLDGGIVILQDVDRMAPALLVWLCRELRRRQDESIIAGDADDLSASQPTLRLLDHCHKVVFVFISSSVGAKSIVTNIRTHGGISSIPRHGLLLDMLHEIDTHFASSSLSLSQSFHAVAPFFPLGRQELSQILRHKVDELSQSRTGIRWSHLTITDAAIEALLDPRQIEYLSWKQLNDRDTPPLLTFSSTGARALQEGTPLMNKLKSKIKACFAGAQPERVAVVDYDDSQDEVLMQWCSLSPAVREEWKPPCDVTCRYRI